MGDTSPTVTLDNITDDNIINIEEYNGILTITGSVSGGFQQGDTVTLTLNGDDYSELIRDGIFNKTAMGTYMAEDTIATVSFVITDSAGNSTTITDSKSYTLDLSAPTVTITDNTAGTAIGDVTYTFTFSEGVTDFTIADITVAGGDKGTFATISENEYTLVVTPTTDSTADITVNVAAGVATDIAGNDNTAAAESTQAVDTTSPTVVISDDTVGTATGDVTYTFTFSEAVSGFTVEDIDVTGGTKGTLTGSGNVYTLIVSPLDDSTTNITVDVAADVVTDAAGNSNSVATQHSQPVDTSVPSLDTSVVVFDLVEGASSSHSERTFDGDTSYTIYIKVGSNSNALETGSVNGSDFMWLNADNLGTDDKIVLVGDGSSIMGVSGTVTRVWSSSFAYSWIDFTSFPGAAINHQGIMLRHYSDVVTTSRVDLWDGTFANPNSSLPISQVYLTTLPAGILTSQGLV